MPKSAWEAERSKSITHGVTTLGTVIKIPKFIDIDALLVALKRLDIRFVLLASWPRVCMPERVYRLATFMQDFAEELSEGGALCEADAVNLTEVDRLIREAQERGNMPKKGDPRRMPLA